MEENETPIREETCPLEMKEEDISADESPVEDIYPNAELIKVSFGVSFDGEPVVEY